MEKKKCLLFIVSEENVHIIKSKGIIGFKQRFLKSLRKLSIGDEVILYIKGKKLMGIFNINSELYEDKKEMFPDETYPLRLKLAEKGKIKRKPFINEFIDKLDFITNKVHWMGNFQGKSLISLEKKDFNLLRDYLNEK